MNRDSKGVGDRLDALLNACNPVEWSSLATRGIESALGEIGAAIIRGSHQAPPAARWRSFNKPRTIVIAAAVLVATATVAAAAAVSAHTGQFQPTQQQIADASPSDAARMKSELAMGGPGEFLDPAAPDFREVALQLASDIPYPQGYESWRDFLISDEVRTADGSTESSGALHGWFAASAFCAWV